MKYEKANGRETDIVCDDEDIIIAANKVLAQPKDVIYAQLPAKITECTACKQKGCLTEYVCHITSIENAKSIFSCGKILSAVKATNKSNMVLANDNRNAAGDPPDYFDYIMFAWGNCQAGDRLVMERMLGRMPNEEDLGMGFAPGVRFYFKYNTIINHPDFLFDGHHPVRIKDGIELSDYMFACIIPEQYKSEIVNLIPANIKEIVYFIRNDCVDIWEWSEKVYNFIESLEKRR